MAKVIVFGGSGFIGSHVADALTEAGHDVLIYDTRASDYLGKDQKMFVGDILDVDAINDAVSGCEYVYNFAGIADLDGARTKPLGTVVQNIQGTVNILEAARSKGIKRFIQASTIYVYSEKGGFYRCSKQAAELYIEEFQRRYKFDYTILRYGTVYGPRSDERNSVHRYLSQALREKKISCAASGEEVREYIHVRDAAALSVAILEERHRNQHVIITGHHPMKFKDFLAMIREILGNTFDVQLEEVSASDMTHYNATPYSFIPRIGYKFTSNCYLDMGQGLLECVNDINAKMRQKV